jgi:hypothetical protein
MTHSTSAAVPALEAAGLNSWWAKRMKPAT